MSVNLMYKKTLTMDFSSVFLVVLSSLSWCSGLENLIATPLIQSFYSHPGYDGSTNYPLGNYTIDWYITTNWINHTIKINIKTCCGTNFPGTLWESSMGEMYILFETDQTVADTGFEIEYWSNGITTTTSTTPAPTTDNSLYIIIACAVTGLLVLVVVVLIIVMCIKKNRPVGPQPFLVQNEKHAQMKNGKAKITLKGPPPTPPLNTIMNPKTNLFDLDLPEEARGNLLPPLTSSTVANNPSS